jgi:hypothetical protein
MSFCHPGIPEFSKEKIQSLKFLLEESSTNEAILKPNFDDFLTTVKIP